MAKPTTTKATAKPTATTLGAKTILTFAQARAKHDARLELAKADYADPKRTYYRYPRCETCGRSIAHMVAHTAAHKSGLIGKDGKRTDRKPAEAKALASRFNGTDATKKFKKTAKAK